MERRSVDATLSLPGATLGVSTLTALGFSARPALAEVSAFKLARTTEPRHPCPYCSVSCGIVMYSLGDKAKNAKSSIFISKAIPTIRSTAAGPVRRSEGRSATRFHQGADSLSRISGAGLGRVEVGFLGLGDGA